jgi:GxxExxY protein
MRLVHGDLTEKIIGAAVEVHRHLGPGLLESSYRRCLVHELGLRGLRSETEIPVPLEYKGLRLGNGYRLDVLVEDTVVVEVKTVAALLPVHEAQILTYLRLCERRVGLLINFHVPLIKDGIKRMAL